MRLGGQQESWRNWHGALLIDKHAGITSFGILETLQRQLRDAAARETPGTSVKRKELPKLGHGGTLDPFATGLLIVCVGDGAKLARYFLDSDKRYAATLRFGETSVSGDVTDEVVERSARLPSSLEALNAEARRMESEPYLQVPPMHSAKKIGGKPLYELARQGKTVERAAQRCTLRDFRFSSYAPPHAEFETSCSSGTYIRTLAQDFSRRLGTVGLLTSLRRLASGSFEISRAWTADAIGAAIAQGRAYPELGCWIDFHRLLDAQPGIEASETEVQALRHGKQSVLPQLIANERIQSLPHDASSRLVVRSQGRLVAVLSRNEERGWEIERVFNESSSASDADS